MTPRNRLVLRRVIDDLAHALQLAIGLATRIRRDTQETADEAVMLEAAIGRAVSALRRLQPLGKGGRRRGLRARLKRGYQEPGQQGGNPDS